LIFKIKMNNLRRRQSHKAKTKLTRREKKNDGQYKFLIKEHHRWVSEYPDNNRSRHDDNNDNNIIII